MNIYQIIGMVIALIFGVALSGFFMLKTYQFRTQIDQKYKDSNEESYLVKGTMWDLYIVGTVGTLMWSVPMIVFRDIINSAESLAIILIGILACPIILIFWTISMGNIRILVEGENITLFRFMKEPVHFMFDDIKDIKGPYNSKVTVTTKDKVKFQLTMDGFFSLANSSKFYAQIKSNLKSKNTL